MEQIQIITISTLAIGLILIIYMFTLKLIVHNFSIKKGVKGKKGAVGNTGASEVCSGSLNLRCVN